jgi:tetratricopeptide (TPR) repeat protein
MKKILFILVLLCMVLSCDNKEKAPKLSKDEEIYQNSGIKETIAFLEKEIKKKPSDKGYYYAKMGYYYIEEKDFENAEKFLNKALEIDPGLGFAYNELGYMYSAQGKGELALETYVKGAGKDPKMGGNFYGAGVLYSELGKYKEAEGYLEKAVTIYEEAGDIEKAGRSAKSLYYVYWALGDEKKVQDFISKAISSNLKKSYFLSQKANIYNREGKFDEALKYNLEGIKADPEEAENYFGAGVNYYNKRNNKQALKHFEKVVPMYKKNNNIDYLGDAYAYLYKINTEEGNKEQAAEIEAAAQKEIGKENWEKKKF